MRQFFLKLQLLILAFPMQCCVVLGSRLMNSRGNRNNLSTVPGLFSR